jgi:hypothetical protein
MADDRVGYRHPPVHSRFKPGQSGNPMGRPKKAQNASTLIGAVLGESIPVRENGRTRKISKLEASLTQLANKAAAGDVRAILAVVALAQGVEARGEPEEVAVPLDEADRRVLSRLIDRVRSQAGADE